jgi:enamine deaminase RidA (YjgF/YER057c/UK114 family)
MLTVRGGPAAIAEHRHPPVARGEGVPSAAARYTAQGAAGDDSVMADAGLSHIPAPEGVAPGRGYTHVVTGSGRLVAVSGQVALDERGEVVGAGDPAAQARQVFENLRRCLAAAGADFGDVVKLTYYLTDVTHLPAVRAVRDELLGAERLPASTAVQVVALVSPELLLEVEALALVEQAGA